MTNRVVSVELRALVDNYVSGFKKASQATSDLADKAGSKLEKHSAEISQMGTQFAVAGAGMLLVAGKAVKTFADFDKAMSGVAATGDEAKARLGELRELAIDLGADTQYSAQEAAEGITNLIKAGVSAEDVIGGGLTGALNLAAAGEMAVADAAETTAITLAQFRLKGDQAAHVADLLAAGAGKASGEVSDMAQALSQVGLVANQTGLSVEETTGALAAFGQAGLIGSDAGTSLKTMLQRLTPQSAEARKQFDQLGISAYDANGEFVGLANFAGQLQDKLGKLTPEARNAAMGVMFGSDAIRAANVLYDQGADGIQGWIDAVNDQGYASRQAAELTNNLSGDVERLGGSLDSVFIKSGSGANTVLRRLTQGAEAAVDAVGGLPEPLLSTMTLLTGAGGLASVGVGGLLKLSAAAADAKANFRALGVNAKTAKIAVGGVASALAIGTLALSVWADASAKANDASREYASTMVVVGDHVSRTSATIEVFNKRLTETKTDWLSDFLGTGQTVAELARDVGISFELMGGYVSGTADGMQAYRDKVVQLRNENPRLASELHTLTTALENQRNRMADGEKTALAQAEAARASGSSATSYADAVSKATTATQANTAATRENADVLNEWIATQWKAAEDALALSGSQVGFERALDDTTAAMKKLAKETKNKTDLTNVDKKAGQDAKDLLDKTAASTLNRVKAMQKAKVADSEVAAEMERGRKAFVAQARAAGFTEDAIADLVNKYDLLPQNVTTKVGEDGAQEAETRVNDLFNALKDLPKSQQAKILSTFNDKGVAAAEKALNKVRSKTVTLTVDVNYNRLKSGLDYFGKKSADGGVYAASLGGLIQQFASGGFGQPQVRPYQGAAGVQWGEQGSGPWEAFISGAPQKRDRSIAIWKEVGRRLLGTFSAEDLIAQFADGGIAEPTHKGKPLSFWKEHLKTDLELTRMQIEIRDLKKDLAEKETYTTGKGKKRKKRKRDKLRGLDRTEAQQQLAETEEEYGYAVEAKKLNASKQGAIDARIEAWEAERDAADEASQASKRWQDQFMTGASAADLLANMQEGAARIAEFNDLLGKLDSQGLSDSMMSWLWDQGPGAVGVAGEILAGGKASIDAFNKSSGNLAKVADAAGQSQATGTWVKSPVIDRVNLPGYMTSGANGAVVGNRTVTFNVTQSDPYAAAVYFDQQLRYL